MVGGAPPSILAAVALAEELERIASLAARHAAEAEEVGGVLAAEPSPGRRIYLCAYVDGGEQRTWLAFDEDGAAVDERATVREAASIAAMCEVAVDVAGGGDLETLRAELLALRLRESPPGIEAAEEAALVLERTVGAAPRVATAAYLDEIGGAAVRLERALGDDAASPFAAAMKQAVGAVELLAEEVERSYKLPLR